ncbi:MAG TPA: hypothetical protein VGF88_14650 [Acidobacteriaceae bacterium]|jgi:hypothetical protein
MAENQSSKEAAGGEAAAGLIRSGNGTSEHRGTKVEGGHSTLVSVGKKAEMKQFGDFHI